ncbi:hypothetical protein [Altericista sp. CCNU0014]|uniref:hypothetical protein n=1 Tax=Altericista sp. CCNU0014 TaxID=3082949 RepID=UPI00385080FC
MCQRFKFRKLTPSAKKYILEYSQNKVEIYEQYGFSLQGSISSKDWEVFAAILLNDRARRGDGADFDN